MMSEFAAALDDKSRAALAITEAALLHAGRRGQAEALLRRAVELDPEAPVPAPPRRALGAQPR